MSGRAVLTALLLMLLISAHAARAEVSFDSYDVTVTVNGDLSTDQEILATFTVSDDPINSLDFVVSGDVESPSSFQGVDLPVYVEKNGNTRLTVYFGKLLKPGTYTVRLGFLSNDFIAGSGSDKHALYDFVSPGRIDDFSLKVILPPGMILSESNPLYPDGIVTTNGQNIIAEWKDSKISADERWLFKATFMQSTDGDAPLILPVLLALSVITMAALAALYMKQKKNAKSGFMEGLSDKEKKIVTYLMEKGISKQSVMEKELEFSKASMARMLMKLDEKGIIRKEKHGKTNKVTLLK